MANYNSQLIDVNNKAYLAGALSVTTTPVEVKVGASRLEGREMVRIYNNNHTTSIYFGPEGVTASTGEPLRPGESVSIPIGPDLAVFIVAASGTVDVRIQEMA